GTERGRTPAGSGAGARALVYGLRPTLGVAPGLVRAPERVPSNLIRVMPAEESVMSETSNERPGARLQVASPDTKPVTPLPPLHEHFPSSRRVYEGDLGVP